MSSFVQGHRKRSARFRRARLLVVALLPWLLLTLANGGRHNHSLSAAHDPAHAVAVSGPAGVECQPGQVGVERGEATRGSRFCLACAWQLNSETSPVAGPAGFAEQAPTDLAGPPQIVAAPPVSRPFDCRAPPAA